MLNWSPLSVNLELRGLVSELGEPDPLQQDRLISEDLLRSLKPPNCTLSTVDQIPKASTLIPPGLDGLFARFYEEYHKAESGSTTTSLESFLHRLIAILPPPTRVLLKYMLNHGEIPSVGQLEPNNASLRREAPSGAVEGHVHPCQDTDKGDTTSSCGF